MTMQRGLISRREMLRRLFLTGSAAVAAPWLAACSGGDSGIFAGDPGGMGQLSIPPGPLANMGALGAPDIDNVAVAEGFSVRAVARFPQPPALGGPNAYPWHLFPDGGAVYTRDNGGWIYVSNSESLPGGGITGGAGALVFDPDGTIVDAYPILLGTSLNCAGGKTPWNTWLSCEEFDFSTDGLNLAGQVHECDPFGTFLDARAKPALGMFQHEAAVVDLDNRTVYLTEDQGDGRFYRWVADTSDFNPGQNRLNLASGTLQVMNIAGFEDGGYPDNPAMIRELQPVIWKDAVNPGMPQAGVRAGMDNPPGTRFDGGEGLWFYELPPEARSIPPGGNVPTKGVVFFTTKGDNRVFALDVENQLIELIFDNAQISPDFNDVDNLTVSPWGDIVVAEDGPLQRLMVVVPNEPAKVLAQVDHPGSELTGPAFTPDGSRLYFSSQRGPILEGVFLPLRDLLDQVPEVAEIVNEIPFANIALSSSGFGVTYELTIPPEFRGA